MPAGYKKTRKKKGRRKWLPWLATGFFGLHALLVLLIAQCSGPDLGYQNQVSYIRVSEDVVRDRVSLEFEEPQARLFPQYISRSSDDKGEQVPIAITEEPWNGWETLDALKVDEEGEILRENFRLTLERVDPRENLRGGIVPFPQFPEFPIVRIGGELVQPMTVVPEPSVLTFAMLACFGCFVRRRGS